jgi:rhodanese-related sulfurtransferase
MIKRLLAFSIAVAAYLAACTGPNSKTIDAPDLGLEKGISILSPAVAYSGTKAAYSQFIDVRSEAEYAAGHADRARNIPLETLSANLDMIERAEPVYVICRTDNRSRQAAAILIDAGFTRVVVVEGGTEAWKAAGLPMVGQG